MEKNEILAVFKTGDLVLARIAYPGDRSIAEFKADACSLAVNVWRGLNALSSLSVYVNDVEVTTFTR